MYHTARSTKVSFIKSQARYLNSKLLHRYVVDTGSGELVTYASGASDRTITPAQAPTITARPRNSAVMT